MRRAAIPSLRRTGRHWQAQWRGDVPGLVAGRQGWHASIIISMVQRRYPCLKRWRDTIATVRLLHVDGTASLPVLAADTIVLRASLPVQSSMDDLHAGRRDAKAPVTIVVFIRIIGNPHCIWLIS